MVAAGFPPLSSNFRAWLWRASSLRKTAKTAYRYPIFLLISTYIISTIFSINIQNSIKETIKFISYISIFFIVSQTNSDQKRALIKTMIAAAAIITIYSIYQYFLGYQHTLEYLRKTNSDFLLNSSYAKDILISKRAIGTFPSPNILGGYLIIIFFLALHSLKAGFQSRRNLSFRVSLRAAPLIPISLALLLTKSLGAWLSLIAALFILLLLSYKSLKQRKLILISSFVIIALVLSFILFNRWERLTNLQNPQNSISQRLNYWRTAIAVIKNHLLLGVGPGNFYLAYPKYKIGLSTDTRYAHNLFFHIWAETGILGLIGIFYLIITFFKKIKSKSEYKFLLLGVTAFTLHNLIDNTYFIPEASFLWWVLLAIAS
jgi:O-antigen ligase